MTADKRGLLDEAPFAYRVGKAGVVSITYFGKQVTVLRGGAAEKFLHRIVGLEDKEAQLVMAKATGNFKRGNERAKR